MFSRTELLDLLRVFMYRTGRIKANPVQLSAILVSAVADEAEEVPRPWTKWLTRGEHWVRSRSGRFRLAPKSSIVEVPNGNHYLFLANQAIVLAELRSFLRALPR